MVWAWDLLLCGFFAAVSRPPPVASFSLCDLRLFVIKRIYRRGDVIGVGVLQGYVEKWASGALSDGESSGDVQEECARYLLH